MTLTADQAERAEFSGRRGDTIEREWTRASGATAYDAGSELVQIRRGPKESDRLYATSDHAAQTAAEFVAQTGADEGGDTFAADLAAWLVLYPVAEITTTGTDLEGDPAVIAWQITADEYVKLPAGDLYWVGVDVTVDGDPREIQRHTWSVLDQTAVRGS